MFVKTTRSAARDYLEAILVALIIGVVLRAFVVQAYRIPSESMEGTLLPGDYLLVSVEPTRGTPPEFQRRTWWIEDGWDVGSDPRLGDGAIVARKSGACWIVAPPLLSAVTAVPSQDGLCEMASKIWTMASKG